MRSFKLPELGIECRLGNDLRGTCQLTKGAKLSVSDMDVDGLVWVEVTAKDEDGRWSIAESGSVEEDCLTEGMLMSFVERALNREGPPLPR